MASCYSFAIMWKYLAIFVVLLGITICVSIEDQKYADSPAKQSAVPAQLTSPNTAHQEETHQTTSKTNGPPPSWHRFFSWPEGITAWAIFLTLIAIAEQTRETAKAAKASQLSADNAEKSVTALVNSERAWIMADLRFEPGNGLVWGDDGTAFDGQTMATVILSIKNSGPTPAWVYEQFIHLEVSPKILASLDTYQSPNFPFLGEGKEMFVSREIHPISQGDDPIGTRAWVRDNGIPTTENGLYVYIYGVVRYRDAFDSKRETYFGYAVKGNRRLERIPNEAYNKHT